MEEGHQRIVKDTNLWTYKFGIYSSRMIKNRIHQKTRNSCSDSSDVYSSSNILINLTCSHNFHPYYFSIFLRIKEKFIRICFVLPRYEKTWINDCRTIIDKDPFHQLWINIFSFNSKVIGRAIHSASKQKEKNLSTTSLLT